VGLLIAVINLLPALLGAFDGTHIKPHFSQLINLASDKWAIPGLIVD
jgi:hypothetical protein